MINDASLSDVLARHPRWAHDVFENRTAKPVDEAKSLEAFAPWQHQVLAQIGGESGHAVTPGDKVLSWKLPLLSCDRAGGTGGVCGFVSQLKLSVCLLLALSCAGLWLLKRCTAGELGALGGGESISG